MCNNISNNIGSTARNTSPPGTAYTNGLRRNALNWVDLSAFSFCLDSSLFKQFLQLSLHLLHKCIKAGIQQTNTQDGLQFTLCQRTVTIYLGQSHGSLSQEVLWKVEQIFLIFKLKFKIEHLIKANVSVHNFEKLINWVTFTERWWKCCALG